MKPWVRFMRTWAVCIGFGRNERAISRLPVQESRIKNWEFGIGKRKLTALRMVVAILELESFEDLLNWR